MRSRSPTSGKISRGSASQTGAPPIQVREMKRAWYSGAATMMSVVTNGLDADKEPTELDIAFMESIQRELEIFANRLGVGLE